MLFEGDADPVFFPPNNLTWQLKAILWNNEGEALGNAGLSIDRDRRTGRR